jgi:alanine-glyoxylate transaminase/serine-glyoxylate transaminase/serine-pyruvate transaminase
VWADWHPFPITQATSIVLALRESLLRLQTEGLPVRLARYQALALRLRRGLRAIGMPPYTPDERLAPVVTAAHGPAGVPTSRIVEYLAREHQIKIAGGMGELRDKVFRIGHMSPGLTEADMDEVVEKLGRFPK